MIKVIENLPKIRDKYNWYETYWAFDLHGTVIKPNYKKGDSRIEFYPYAKESLQFLSNRDDVRLIMSTSSYPEELKIYRKVFAENNIVFGYENENLEINEKHFGYYNDKWYFNILFEDKAGFDPEEMWEGVYNTVLKFPEANIEFKRKDIILVDNIPIILKDSSNIEELIKFIGISESHPNYYEMFKFFKIIPSHLTDEQIKNIIKKLKENHV